MAHGETQSGVVVVEPCAAVVPHVACEDAPVRREVDLEQSCHPVALVVLGGQVLEFETARKLRGPLVEQVGDDDVRQADVAARHLAVLVIFLRRVQKHHLEFLCPLLLYIETEVAEQKFAALHSSCLIERIISREIGMYLHSSLSTDGCTTTEVVERVYLSSHFTGPDDLVSDLGSVWIQSREHVGVLS